MNRGAARRKANQQVAKARANDQQRLWRKLSDTTPHWTDVGYKGASGMDAPAFYCPYIPIMRTVRVDDE